MKANKYQNGGATNKEMRESDRASRESYKKSKPERKISRRSKSSADLLKKLESYDSAKEERRKTAKKFAGMAAGVGALAASGPAMGRAYQRALDKQKSGERLTAGEKLALRLFTRRSNR
jgi:hypothetical protein